MPTIRVTATDSQGASGQAEATIGIGDPNIEITRLEVTPSMVAPGGSCTVIVEGTNYTDVRWSSSSALGEGTFVELSKREEQRFTVHSIVRAETVYTITVSLLNAQGFGVTQSVTITIINVAPEVSDITLLNGDPFPDVLRVSSTGFARVPPGRDNNGDGLTYNWSGDRIESDSDIVNLPINHFAYICPDRTNEIDDNGDNSAKDYIRCVVSDLPPNVDESLSVTSQKNVILDSNAPTAPIIQEVADSNITDDSILVQWAAPNSDGGAPITGYHISHRVTIDSWGPDVTIDANIRQHRLQNLRSGTTYDIRIRAFNYFDVDGDSYGQVGPYAETRATTTGRRIEIPTDIPDVNQAPVIYPITPLTPTTPLNEPIDIVADYVDPDGDSVTVNWNENGGGGTLEVITPANHDPNAFYPSVGTTTVRYTPPDNTVENPIIFLVVRDQSIAIAAAWRLSVTS